ncbi:AraC family transcriptional regulator [Paenibacillus sp. Marseille-Q7038]
MKGVKDIKHYETSVTMLYTLVKTLSYKGHDVEVFLSSHGLQSGLLKQPGARIAAKQHMELMNAAALLLADEFFGLHQGRRMEMADLGAVGYVMMHSGTLGEAIAAYQRYHIIACSGYGIVMEEAGEKVILRLSLEGLQGNVSRHCTEDMIGSLVHMLSRLSGIPTKLHTVSFTHAPPDSGDFTPYIEVLGTLPDFEAAANEIRFDRSVLDYPVMYANGELVAWFEQQAEEVRKKLTEGQQFTDEVMHFLIDQLRSHIPTLKETAAAFHMGVRTFQGKLQLEKTSYTQVLASVRKELALRYLGKEGYSISDIAYMLHFSEESAFHHAFKHWTGNTPGQYRVLREKM